MGILLEHVNRRWLPPSPHLEAIEGWLEKGRAHIEKQGHNRAPALIFEDGGRMELNDGVRIDSRRGRDSHGLWHLTNVNADSAASSTRFPDVCGAMNRMEELVNNPEQWDGSGEELVERLCELIDQAVYMVERMGKRMEAYRNFAVEVKKISDQMQDVETPAAETAAGNARRLREYLHNNPEGMHECKEQLTELAREVRGVAGNTEQKLYSFRDSAIELGRLFREIKGGRDWSGKH